MNQSLKNATFAEIVQGYKETESSYRCLICGKLFEKGEVFEENGHYYDAKKMVEIHTEKEHGRMVDVISGMEGKDLGLTDAQLAMMVALAYEKSDEEIYDEFQISPSTIRNYRQKIKEKQQQAKMLLALTQLIEEEKKKGTLHLNRKEKQIVQNYFNEDGTLKELPSKEKKKMVVLKHVIQPLKVGKVYSEQEINRFLKGVCDEVEPLKEALLESKLLVCDEDNNYSKQKGK